MRCVFSHAFGNTLLEQCEQCRDLFLSVQIINEVNRTGRRQGKESRKRDWQESMRLQERVSMTVKMSQDERNTDERLMSEEGSGGREQLLTVLAVPWFVITVTLILSLSVSCCVRFPVILSIENHCSIQQQKKIAQHLKEIFGDKLDVAEALNKDPKQIPSPNSLKGKILLKVRCELLSFCCLPKPQILNYAFLFPAFVLFPTILSFVCFFC